MQAFEAVNHYFDQAAVLLDLSDNMRTLMITPDRELRVEVAIEMDSGQIGNFIGYRVQHDNARGPFKGGLRFHPHVDQDEARSDKVRAGSERDSGTIDGAFGFFCTGLVIA